MEIALVASSRASTSDLNHNVKPSAIDSVERPIKARLYHAAGLAHLEHSRAILDKARVDTPPRVSRASEVYDLEVWMNSFSLARTQVRGVDVDSTTLPSKIEPANRDALASANNCRNFAYHAETSLHLTK